MFQEKTMYLAAESLYNHDRDDRNVSSVTFTVNRKDLPDISDMIDQFRTTLMAYSKNTDRPDNVYQLGIQLFPLTRPEDES